MIIHSIVVWVYVDDNHGSIHSFSSFNSDHEKYIILFVSQFILGSMNSEIEKSCSNNSGFLYEIDSIYRKGDQVMCAGSCSCTASMFYIILKLLWA